MWAAIPMFLVNFKSLLAIVIFLYRSFLESEMRESSVCFNHSVRIFFFLKGSTFFFCSGNNFVSQSLTHRFLIALPRIAYQPLHRNCQLTVFAHRLRNLKSSSTHTTTLYLYGRSNVGQSFFPDFEARGVFAFLINYGDSIVKNIVRQVFLTRKHHIVYKLGNHDLVKFRIWQRYAFFSGLPSHDLRL